MIRCGTIALLVKARLTEGFAALDSGDGMIAVVTSWLTASLGQTGILPFSLRERRSLGMTTLRASVEDFCLGFHINLDRGRLGSQGT